MNRFFKRYFLSITLLSLGCLSIFANEAKSSSGSQKGAQDNSPSSSITQLQDAAKIALEREIFQSYMSQARQQTQTIGFCLQQLSQTIDAQKISLTKEQKQHVTKEVVAIQNFTKILLEKLFVLNSKEALHEAILINHVLIDYLFSVVKADITTIEACKIHEHLVKKSKLELSEELLFALAEKNQEDMAKLVNATDNVGLRWYNHAYRGLQKYNAYTVAKGVAITAASIVAIGYIAGHLDDLTPQWILDSNFHKNWINCYPFKRDPTTGGYTEIDKNITYKTNPTTGETETVEGPLTPVQLMIKSSRKLNKGKLLTIGGALLTISYADLFAKLYKDPIDWLQAKSKTKLDEINKILLGTAKPNLSNDGEEKVYFKDMVGCEHLEEIANKIASFMQHPERYERADLAEHSAYLLEGPPQTGKTLFAKALRTLVAEKLGADKKVSFIDAKKILDSTSFTIEDIFAHAAYYSPCIIFFDEIDLVGTHRDKNPLKTSQLLTCMQGVDGALKQVFVIGATNRPEQLDQALLVDGRFGKRIHIGYPKYEHRKIFLQQQLEKRCVTLSPEYIDCMAQETNGCSYNMLKRIITEALIQSSREMRSVCQSDFEKSLDTEVRRIQQATAMSDDEKRIIATYQAGKAIARHILQTNQEVVKLTVNTVGKDIKTVEAAFTIKTSTDVAGAENENLAATKKDQKIKLGDVFTKSQANLSELLSDEEQRKECLALLAGNAALQLMLKQSYTQCNKHDRADVMQIIYNMISNGEKIDEKTKTQAIALKDQYEKEIAQLLAPHKALIEKIVALLMKQNTIDRYEWKALIK
ncbi:MAG: AAA family ATPase [Candidatus Dependentiae bacterium]|nr:AAA family ATPase [Candidatus Dependentiae bacterium]